MTRYPHAAPRRTLRVPGWWIGLGLMLVSAAVTVAVLIAVTAWFFSLLPYVQSAP